MTHPAHRSRRVAGFLALLGAAGLLVTAKAATAPSPRPVLLASGPAGPTATTPSGRPGPGRATTAAGAPASTARPTGAPAGALTRTVLGTAEDVSYGTVQVSVKLRHGRIVDVTAVQLPSGGRSSQLAAYSAPLLRQEVLAAQSARIDTVSGASYTSQGYAQSVQSALDAARS